MPGYRKSDFQSRIPVRAAPQHAHHESAQRGPAPSKLQQLQAEYQARINHEKEMRLQALFDRQQEQQDRAYNRIIRNSSAESASSSVQNRGSVRQFFKQRRIQNENDTPPNSGRPPIGPYKRNSAGRDRSNPLAPIQKPANNYQNGYSDRRKRPTSRERVNSAGSGSDYGPEIMNPQPPKYKRESQLPRRPNRAAGNQFGPGTINRQDRMTDYQKWQKEQDEERLRRIDKYRKARRDSGSDLDQSFRKTKQNVRRDSGSDLDQSFRKTRQKPPTKRVQRKPVRRQPSTDAEDDDDSETDTARQRRKSREIEQDLIRQKQKELEAQLLQHQQELAAIKRAKQSDAQREADALQRKQKLESERRKLRRPSLLSGDDSDDGPMVPRPPPINSARSNRSTPNTRRKKVPVPREPSPESPPPPPKPVQKPKPKPVKKRRASPPPPPPPEEELPPTSGANDYLNILDGEAEAAPQNMNLKPCPVCGRKFAVERLDKHQTACEKSKNKKPRKVFDMTKKRLGVEGAEYVKNRPKSPEVKKKKSNWREKHEDFINSLRYAKQVTAVENAGGNAADLPPPPPSHNPDYVECPTCGRRFNQKAAERHIPKCKDIKAKPKPLKNRRK